MPRCGNAWDVQTVLVPGAAMDITVVVTIVQPSRLSEQPDLAIGQVSIPMSMRDLGAYEGRAGSEKW